MHKRKLSIMEVWYVFLVSICVSILFKSIFKFPNPKLPPSPPSAPFIGNLLWLRRSVLEIKPVLRSLHAKYGPIVTLRFGSARNFIFVASHSLAHRALIQHGAVFADRPPPRPTGDVLSNRLSINSAAYGPTWRLLRRNLTSQLLHPSRSLASFSPIRHRVLGSLVDSLDFHSRSGEFVLVLDHFRYAVFSLLVFMCFGDDGGDDDDVLHKEKIEEIMAVFTHMLKNSNRYRVLNLWPRLGKILFRNRWKEYMEVVDRRTNVLIPLIRRRRRIRANEKEVDCDNLCYVDTLMDLEVPDEEEEEGKRKLTEEEMMSLCLEFLTAGTDTTTTALQWIMANLVKYPQIQDKLFTEISDVLNPRKGEEVMVMVEEDDLQRMRYLKAVIMEALRRHPPSHFLLPHAVTEEIELGGYVIPKNATVNFMVAEMGWDPKVWEDPMGFKPERFFVVGDDYEGEGEGKVGGEDGFDITGSREIKMMPFGVGRRICPGLGLAMLHLEYFVANLVWRYEWKAVVVDGVDLSERDEFTVVMKNPLRAKLSPRRVGSVTLMS